MHLSEANTDRSGRPSSVVPMEERHQLKLGVCPQLSLERTLIDMFQNCEENGLCRARRQHTGIHVQCDSVGSNVIISVHTHRLQSAKESAKHSGQIDGKSRSLVNQVRP